MYEYQRRSRLGFGSILLIVLFIMIVLGLLVLYFVNKGKFWDFLPVTSIVIIVLSLIFAIFNMARRTSGGFIFIIFFLMFLAGLVLSSLFGPFALNKNAQKAVDEGDYNTAIKNYDEIIKNYSTSKYYDEALKNIASDYNKIGDYENTIKYLNLGIEKKILDPESLDVKQMFSDSYSKLAERAYENKDYNSASLNFVMTINILKDILAKFPKSDEAFISTYKIPEYLYKAADSYKKMGSFSQGIEILKELVKDYPESDYSKQSGNLIFDSYVEEVLSLIENSKYKEALDEYLTALDLASASGAQIQSQSYDSQIFTKIPEDALLEYAINICEAGKYKSALKIFTFFLNSYPEQTETVNPYYAVCKINIISTEIYKTLPEIKESFKIKNQGNFILNVTNKSNRELVIYFNSDKGSLFRLKAKGKLDIVLPMGSYDIAAEFSDNMAPVYYGQFKFEENKRYSQIFPVEDSITETNNKSESTTTTATTTASNETTTTQ